MVREDTVFDHFVHVVRRRVIRPVENGFKDRPSLHGERESALATECLELLQPLALLCGPHRPPPVWYIIPNAKFCQMQRLRPDRASPPGYEPNWAHPGEFRLSPLPN